MGVNCFMRYAQGFSYLTVGLSLESQPNYLTFSGTYIVEITVRLKNVCIIKWLCLKIRLLIQKVLHAGYGIFPLFS